MPVYDWNWIPVPWTSNLQVTYYTEHKNNNFLHVFNHIILLRFHIFIKTKWQQIQKQKKRKEIKYHILQRVHKMSIHYEMYTPEAFSGSQPCHDQISVSHSVTPSAIMDVNGKLKAICDWGNRLPENTSFTALLEMDSCSHNMGQSYATHT